jgi:hypothetical protein
MGTEHLFNFMDIPEDYFPETAIPANPDVNQLES